MKNMKRIGSLLMAVVMVMALSVTAFAADFTNGEAGAWTQPDTKIGQDAFINLKKEIIAFNPNGSKVHAPEITFTYEVIAAEVDGLTVTDAAGDHESKTPVSVPVKPGITEGLKVGSLEFTNEDTWETAAEGKANSYDIRLDFSEVTFTQPGVYRYMITEATPAASYEGAAMKDGGNNTLYLDVYVDGSFAIYGYVCMAANGSVDTATNKINGFVGSETEASDGSDKYYTYDLTLSKTVVNDAYAKAAVAFPFTVIFSNSENYTSTFTIGESVGSGSEGISPAAASAPTWSGVAKVKDGGAITYTGIPAGVDVEVYETNIASGVTYAVDTSVNKGAAVSDAAVIWGEAPSAAVAQAAEKADYESTKAIVDTAKGAAAAAQSVAITNTLLLISPTGVALRVAPFVLMLAAGAVLLFFARRRRSSDEG